MNENDKTTQAEIREERCGKEVCEENQQQKYHNPKAVHRLCP